MKNNWIQFISNIRWYLLATAILFSLALISETFFSIKKFNSSDTKDFQKKILQKEIALQEGFEEIIDQIPEDTDSCCFFCRKL